MGMVLQDGSDLIDSKALGNRGEIDIDIRPSFSKGGRIVLNLQELITHAGFGGFNFGRFRQNVFGLVRAKAPHIDKRSHGHIKSTAGFLTDFNGRFHHMDGFRGNGKPAGHLGLIEPRKLRILLPSGHLPVDSFQAAVNFLLQGFL